MLANTMQSQHSIFKVKNSLLHTDAENSTGDIINRNPDPGLISHKRYNV